MSYTKTSDYPHSPPPTQNIHLHTSPTQNILPATSTQLQQPNKMSTYPHSPKNIPPSYSRPPTLTHKE